MKLESLKFWKREKPQAAERIEPEVEPEYSTDFPELPDDTDGTGKTRDQHRADYIESRTFQRKAPIVTGHAMDSAVNPSNVHYGSYDAVNQKILMYYAASSSFIGYNAMAIIGQHWLVAKGCGIDVDDATKKWYKIGVNDGTELSSQQIKFIEKQDKKYKLKQNMVEAVTFNNIFGIRHILFKHRDPDFDYEKPFNPDSWKAGDYAGISQVDPYWLTPELDTKDITDPTSIGYYCPTFWLVNGKRYHKSHFVILIGEEVADMLKPTYRYGGISLAQKVYERVYAAERSANEGPQLLMTKRLGVQQVDLAAVQKDKAKFIKNQYAAQAHRDNFSTQYINKGEAYDILETALGDVDTVIMTQYQLVCSIFDKPATRLLGTSPNGFGTGETDYDYDIAKVEALQGGDLERIAEAHYARLIPTVIKPRLGLEPEIDINWNPIKVMSEKERADIRAANSTADTNWFSAGAIDNIDIRERLANDEYSGYTGMSIPEVVELDNDEETNTP